jgi:hypothetical protein
MNIIHFLKINEVRKMNKIIPTLALLTAFGYSSIFADGKTTNKTLNVKKDKFDYQKVLQTSSSSLPFTVTSFNHDKNKIYFTGYYDTPDKKDTVAVNNYDDLYAVVKVLAKNDKKAYNNISKLIEQVKKNPFLYIKELTAQLNDANKKNGGLEGKLAEEKGKTAALEDKNDSLDVANKGLYANNTLVTNKNKQLNKSLLKAFGNSLKLNYLKDKYNDFFSLEGEIPCSENSYLIAGAGFSNNGQDVKTETVNSDYSTTENITGEDDIFKRQVLETYAQTTTKKSIDDFSPIISLGWGYNINDKASIDVSYFGTIDSHDIHKNYKNIGHVTNYNLIDDSFIGEWSYEDDKGSSNKTNTSGRGGLVLGVGYNDINFNAYTISDDGYFPFDFQNNIFGLGCKFPISGIFTSKPDNVETYKGDKKSQK